MSPAKRTGKSSGKAPSTTPPVSPSSMSPTDLRVLAQTLSDQVQTLTAELQTAQDAQDQAASLHTTQLQTLRAQIHDQAMEIQGWEHRAASRSQDLRLLLADQAVEIRDLTGRLDCASRQRDVMRDDNDHLLREGTHRFPISRNQLQGLPWLSNFNKQCGNRRSHAGRAWKRVLVILVLAIQDGWCDVDILLDPSFLYLPRRGDKVAWFPGSVSRQANLDDPNLHRPEPTSLLEALREIDEAEPWRIQFRGDLSQRPGRQIQRLVGKFFNVQPKTT
ncbi:hypothetical protein GN958_ATG04165 [Phytophthora infestans]|uniref:Uncharacterized protein n=1 Tax=Phytophthora infestans TaxID=4787 RepID=A0A8S9V5H1_PHYIN|nr:hypothetical protein GN958_ATG04165 [Phytophthora infestans]